MQSANPADCTLHLGGNSMTGPFQSSRDVILRTDKWSEVHQFYGSILGLPIAYQDPRIVGFETGAFRLYVEKGKEHGPVFEFLVPDVEAAKQQLLAAGCTVVEEDPSVPRSYIKDPYGLVFNIGQASGPS
jgi:predicted enzyme related to lactoylglutathione lyase